MNPWIVSPAIDERELARLRRQRDRAFRKVQFYRARGRNDDARQWSFVLREYRGRIRALQPQTF